MITFTYKLNENILRFFIVSKQVLSPKVLQNEELVLLHDSNNLTCQEK